MLSEARIRLVSGLKRYFHDKRGRGLLSAEGVQLLDHACSAAVDQSSKPIAIWNGIERSAAAHIPTMPKFDNTISTVLACREWTRVAVSNAGISCISAVD